MAKREDKRERRTRTIDYMQVLKPMVKTFYMVELKLTQEDVAAGAGVSKSTISRMLGDGRVPIGSGALVFQFFQERVRRRNEEIVKSNAEKGDGQKEELIPMITTLGKWPAGYESNGRMKAVVDETGGVGTEQMIDRCRDAGGACPAVEVLERCLSESVKRALAAEEGSKGGLYVIRVASDKSISVVEIRNYSSVQADSRREACLREMIEPRLAWQIKNGMRRGKPESWEFTAFVSSEGWITIIETTAQSTGAALRDLGGLPLTSESDVFGYVHPDYDDAEAWARFKEEGARLDQKQLSHVGGRGSKAGSRPTSV